MKKILTLASVAICAFALSACHHRGADPDPVPSGPKLLTPAAVDLGLSVLWSDINVGATDSCALGISVAWAETKEKETYDWSTYRYYSVFRQWVYKYCTNETFGPVDGLSVLEASDDAATVNFGASWRTPTKAEWNELATMCTWTLEDNAFKVEGPSGKSITIQLEQGDTYYWTSTMDEYYCENAWAALCDKKGATMYFANRYDGYHVRAVMDK